MNKPRLSPNTVAELVSYASRGLAGMMYTDAELFEKMNEQLPVELKICHRTFQRYKAAAMQYGELAVEQQKYNPLYADLYHAFLRTGMQQKENLIEKMLEADGNKWHRYKWLLEKKFPEFNQGCIMEKFRRENSYLDEDYPMYHPQKHQKTEPLSTAITQPEISVMPPAEESVSIEAASPLSDNENNTPETLVLPQTTSKPSAGNIAKTSAPIQSNQPATRQPLKIKRR